MWIRKVEIGERTKVSEGIYVSRNPYLWAVNQHVVVLKVDTHTIWDIIKKESRTVYTHFAVFVRNTIEDDAINFNVITGDENVMRFGSQRIEFISEQTYARNGERVDYMQREPSQGECEVIELIAKGLTNVEIARELNLSENTIKSHVHRLFTLSQQTNRTRLALWAQRNGIIK